MRLASVRLDMNAPGDTSGGGWTVSLEIVKDRWAGGSVGLAARECGPDSSEVEEGFSRRAAKIAKENAQDGLG
jgi:hypothetical protein